MKLTHHTAVTIGILISNTVSGLQKSSSAKFWIQDFNKLYFGVRLSPTRVYFGVRFSTREYSSGRVPMRLYFGVRLSQIRVYFGVNVLTRVGYTLCKGSSKIIFWSEGSNKCIFWSECSSNRSIFSNFCTISGEQNNMHTL